MDDASGELDGFFAENARGLRIDRRGKRGLGLCFIDRGIGVRVQDDRRLVALQVGADGKLAGEVELGARWGEAFR